MTEAEIGERNVEGTTLSALKIEEGSTNLGIQAASRSRKRQGH